MASCEKCWVDARGNSALYHRLLSERDCTPEEQAGPDATTCPECGQRTVHQYARVCMAPDCDYYLDPLRAALAPYSDGDA
jgi:hypothetical protein